MHNTKEYNTTWISADRGSKLGHVCFCSMYACRQCRLMTLVLATDYWESVIMTFPEMFLPVLISVGSNFRAIFVFHENTKKLEPHEKKYLLKIGNKHPVYALMTETQIVFLHCLASKCCRIMRSFALGFVLAIYFFLFVTKLTQPEI